MHQELAGIIGLQLPTGAGPNDPAIVLQDPVPAALTAYYAAGGPNGQVGVVVAAEIFRQDSTDYTYQAQVDPTVGLSFMAFGGIESVGLNITEAYRITPGVGGVLAPPATLNVTGGFAVDGVSHGRGLIDRVSSNVNSAGVVAETLMLTGASKKFHNLRAFEVIVSADVLPLTAVGSCLLFVHRTNLAGTLLGITSEPLRDTAASTHIHWRFVIRNNSGADITTNLVHSLASGTANQVREQGSATQLAYMEINDVGRAADFADCPQL